MAYDTNTIERDLSNAQHTLGQHLSEAEEKARQAVNWRSHYRRNPLPILVAAGVAGALASTLLGRAKGRRPLLTAPGDSGMIRQALSFGSASTAMERLADSLVAAASMKAAEYLEQWIPGFRQEFSRRNQS